MKRRNIGFKDRFDNNVYEGSFVKHYMPKQSDGKGKNLRNVFVGVVVYVEEVASFRTVTSDGLEQPIHLDVELEVLSQSEFIVEILKRFIALTDDPTHKPVVKIERFVNEHSFEIPPEIS